MLRSLTALILACAATSAAAHPHIFVDVSFELFFDAEGKLTKIRTYWLYDAFYSLTIIEERAADTDGDGALSPEEMKPLQGFDSVWAKGSEGDLHVTQAKQAVTIGPPSDWKAVWVDGRLGSYHTRSFDPPIDMTKGPAYIQPYDASYYFAYKIAGPVIFDGRHDCHAKQFEPDLTYAQKVLKNKLSAFSSNAEAEQAGYPAVGANFAETIWVACW